MPDTEPDSKTIIQKDMDYQHTFLTGYFLLFKEASAQGLLAEYEDLVDTLYNIIPSKHKKNLMVFDREMEALSPAYVEWRKALSIGPGLDDERVKEDTRLKVQVRQRCLRKCQIVTDIAQQLNLLGKEVEDATMPEGSELMEYAKSRSL